MNFFYNFDNFNIFFTILTIDDIFHNSDNCFCHFDNWKDNPGDLWHLRHWLQFWQLRTWIHDNLCYLTINCDTGQHSQFLRCFGYFSVEISLVLAENWGWEPYFWIRGTKIPQIVGGILMFSKTEPKNNQQKKRNWEYS